MVSRITELLIEKLLPMRAIFAWFSGLSATVVMVAISYQWLDRPIALLAHRPSQRSPNGWWEMLTHIPNPLIPAAIIAFVILGLRALMTRALPYYQAVGFVCSVSVIVTEVTKDKLKFLFGRSWPESWTGTNPSFIRDGVYGFHFMQGGGALNAFPSGHMATNCAVLAVLWLWYPRFKVYYLIGGLGAGAGLVGANYHFLGDVIAGAFVGASIGWLATAVWRAAVPDVPSRSH